MKNVMTYNGYTCTVKILGKNLIGPILASLPSELTQ